MLHNVKALNLCFKIEWNWVNEQMETDWIDQL